MGKHCINHTKAFGASTRGGSSCDKAKLCRFCRSGRECCCKEQACCCGCHSKFSPEQRFFRAERLGKLLSGARKIVGEERIPFFDQVSPRLRKAGQDTSTAAVAAAVADTAAAAAPVGGLAASCVHPGAAALPVSTTTRDSMPHFEIAHSPDDAATPTGCTCNLMYSVPDVPDEPWLPRNRVHDERYACRGNIYGDPPDWKFYESRVRLEQGDMTRVAVNGIGCKGRMPHHARSILGWVQGHQALPKGKVKCPLIYPWQATEYVVKSWRMIVVPCEHLQLYFEVVFAKTMEYEMDTVCIGFFKYSNKAQLFRVERVTTRTKGIPSSGWTDDDRMKLKPFGDTAMVLEYECVCRVGSPGYTGVLKATTLTRQLTNVTPAALLGCSALVAKSYELILLISELFEKFLPPGWTVGVKKLSKYEGVQEIVGYEMRQSPPIDFTNARDRYSDGYNSDEFNSDE
jgi:hypothetical protein